MELLLVRHGLPLRVETPGTPADPPLAGAGRVQAEALAHHWAPRVDAVWTSPMLRAVQTAAPLVGRLGVEPTVDDDLAEMDRDQHHYIPLEELRAHGPGWAEAVALWVGPEGEEMRRDLRRRVAAAVDRVVAAHRGQRVAVVCHGGVINAALADVLGLGATLFFEPAYTSVSRVVASSSGARQLITVNETWHLDRGAG
ncbi:MAG TPA: histidine phosphatase family protein [Acidimicrobiales bacterium]|nr:histidine phosphatase family protein [Acidimicrobiales bacterium]